MMVGGDGEGGGEEVGVGENEMRREKKVVVFGRRRRGAGER